MSKDRCVRWKRDYVMRPGSAAPTPSGWFFAQPGGRPLIEDEARFYAMVYDDYGLVSGDLYRKPPPTSVERDIAYGLGSRRCGPSVDTARSCKRKMDRQMIVEGGSAMSERSDRPEGWPRGVWAARHPDAVVEPEGPWRCEEYDED